ncbi:hypothetical protein [Kitasatospora sp. NPDC008115]|uniref:hypothetical protein n=1 Tax=Kitasatospora sp. NPDC008115 TaxID=3364022 RepID=UPI0036EBD4F5
MNTNLPDGWTIERVRSVSGDAEAEALTLERLVVVGRPDAILSFHDLCLARADGEWYMGQLDTDGSLV